MLMLNFNEKPVERKEEGGEEEEAWGAEERRKIMTQQLEIIQLRLFSHKIKPLFFSRSC